MDYTLEELQQCVAEGWMIWGWGETNVFQIMENISFVVTTYLSTLMLRFVNRNYLKEYFS